MKYTTRMTSFLLLVLAIVLCELAGALGAVFTRSAIPTWYRTLSKPKLNPPSWVFGPVWTTLYALMGVSVWLIWKSAPLSNIALCIFALQLALNAAWSYIFFGMKRVGLALVDIVLLWLSIVLTIVVFIPISALATWLLAPYLVWVSFASYLNYSIWKLNR